MKKSEHHLLLSWLVLTGLIAFAVYVGWQVGIFNLLYGSDKSKISIVITFIYILITLHCAFRVWYISNQWNYTKNITETIKSSNNLQLSLNNEQVKYSSTDYFPPSVTTEYIHDLVTRNNNQVKNTDNDTSDSELIDVYVTRLKDPDEIGWFASDAMIKLGLLGTIIGFILMLGSVVNVTEFDVTTMQKILAHMSSGMGTALYTTMSGLICSLLATFQYQMIDKYIDDMISSLKHITQVHILPKLAQAE